MSRIGKQPIIVPEGVGIEVADGQVKAKGPKGELQVKLLPGLAVRQKEGLLEVVMESDQEDTLRTWGLQRTLINNIIIGVTAGFSRQLEINGVGYRANVSGSVLNLALGFSHPTQFKLPEGIEAKVERNVVTISGADKQLVGQVAANIRALRKPEPYKGKGIKYIEERIRRKAGKTAAKG